MAVLTRFCFCCGLRAGCMFVATYSLLSSAFFIALLLIRNIGYRIVESSIIHAVVTYGSFVLFGLLMLVSVGLIIGVHRESRWMFIPWLVQTLVALLFATGTIVWLVVTIIRSEQGLENWEIALVAFHSVNLVCSSYCMMCVISLFQDLSKRPPSTRPTRRERRANRANAENGAVNQGATASNGVPSPPALSVVTPPPYNADKPPPYTTFPRGAPQLTTASGQQPATRPASRGGETAPDEDDLPPYSTFPRGVPDQLVASGARTSRRSAEPGQEDLGDVPPYSTFPRGVPELLAQAQENRPHSIHPPPLIEEEDEEEGEEEVPELPERDMQEEEEEEEEHQEEEVGDVQEQPESDVPTSSIAGLTAEGEAETVNGPLPPDPPDQDVHLVPELGTASYSGRSSGSSVSAIQIIPDNPFGGPLENDLQPLLPAPSDGETDTDVGRSGDEDAVNAIYAIPVKKPTTRITADASTNTNLAMSHEGIMPPESPSTEPPPPIPQKLFAEAEPAPEDPVSKSSELSPGSPDQVKEHQDEVPTVHLLSPPPTLGPASSRREAEIREIKQRLRRVGALPSEQPDPLGQQQKVQLPKPTEASQHQKGSSSSINTDNVTAGIGVPLGKRQKVQLPRPADASQHQMASGSGMNTEKMTAGKGVPGVTNTDSHAKSGPVAPSGSHTPQQHSPEARRSGVGMGVPGVTITDSREKSGPVTPSGSHTPQQHSPQARRSGVGTGVPGVAITDSREKSGPVAPSGSHTPQQHSPQARLSDVGMGVPGVIITESREKSGPVAVSGSHTPQQRSPQARRSGVGRGVPGVAITDSREMSGPVAPSSSHTPQQRSPHVHRSGVDDQPSSSRVSNQPRAVTNTRADSPSTSVSVLSPAIKAQLEVVLDRGRRIKQANMREKDPASGPLSASANGNWEKYNAELQTRSRKQPPVVGSAGALPKTLETVLPSHSRNIQERLRTVENPHVIAGTSQVSGDPRRGPHQQERPLRGLPRSRPEGAEHTQYTTDPLPYGQDTSPGGRRRNDTRDERSRDGQFLKPPGKSRERPRSDERDRLRPDERERLRPDERDRPRPDERDRPRPDERDRLRPDERNRPRPDERDRPRPDERDRLRPDERDRPRPDERDRLRPDERDRLRPDERDRLRPDERDRLRPDERDRNRQNERERPWLDEKDRMWRDERDKAWPEDGDLVHSNGIAYNTPRQLQPSEYIPHAKRLSRENNDPYWENWKYAGNRGGGGSPRLDLNSKHRGKRRSYSERQEGDSKYHLQNLHEHHHDHYK